MLRLIVMLLRHIRCDPPPLLALVAAVLINQTRQCQLNRRMTKAADAALCSNFTRHFDSTAAAAVTINALATAFFDVPYSLHSLSHPRHSWQHCRCPSCGLPAFIDCPIIAYLTLTSERRQPIIG